MKKKRKNILIITIITIIFIIGLFCFIYRIGPIETATVHTLPTLVHSRLSLSPDGKRILFSVLGDKANSRQGFDIFAVNLLTNETNQITTDGTSMRPIWCRSGEIIIFESNRHNYSRIAQINIDGSGYSLLNAQGDTTDNWIDNFPKYIPDAQKIFFCRKSLANLENTSDTEKIDYSASIVMVNEDGTDEKTLNSGDVWWYGRWDITADAKQLFFIKDGDVFAFDIENQSLGRLSHGLDVSHIDFTSVDGGKILCLVSEATQENKNVKSVRVITLPTLHITTLISNEIIDCPVWSHNGKKVAFTSFKNDSCWRICIINENGSDCKEIANGRLPIWLKGDNGLAFIRGRTTIFLVQWDIPGEKQIFPSKVQN